MRYLLAIILPPVAVLFSAGIGTAFFNFILTCFFYVPGMIHAVLVVSKRDQQKRHEEMMKVLTQQTQLQAANLAQQQMLNQTK